MDASTWIELIRLYADSFNNNSVPNIDTSWHYICKQKADHSLHTSLVSFDQDLC